MPMTWKRLSVPSVRLWLAALLASALLGVWNAPAGAAEVTPEEIARKTADELLAEIRPNVALYRKDYGKLYRLAEDKLFPLVDFQRMSQYILGMHWRQATPEQRERFVKEFRDMLARTYSTAYLGLVEEEFVFLPSRPIGEDQVMVRMEVRRKGGAPPVPVNTFFYRNKEGAWKAYDVTIEGVSVVTNYRTVYGAKVKAEGLDALISMLSESNRKPVAEGKAATGANPR